MVGQALTIKRFVRGRIYLLQPDVKRPHVYVVARFKKKVPREFGKYVEDKEGKRVRRSITQFVYLFDKLADNLNRESKTEVYTIYAPHVNKYDIKELTLEEMPLYVGSPNTYPALNDVFEHGMQLPRKVRGKPQKTSLNKN